MIKCDYLVGADGVRSLVRKHLGIEMQGTKGKYLNVSHFYLDI